VQAAIPRSASRAGMWEPLLRRVSSAVLSGALEVLLLLGTDSPKGDYSRGQRPKNSVITKASIYKKKVDASLRING
jgi:hypothetical protein